MEIGSNLSESQENISAQPELKENISVQEPIYKTKDGQTVTKSQLIDSGYSEDRINKGVSNKILSIVGDTKHPEQKFTTKDGQTLSSKQLLDSGYSQERIDKGVHNGILSPYIEKKKENFQSTGENPQRASVLSQETKRPSWDTENPKKPLVSDGLVGENKKKLSSVLKENKLESFTTKKKNILKQDKEATLGLTKKSSGSLSVSKPKGPTSMEEVTQGNGVLKPIIAENLYKYRSETKLSDEEKKDTEQQLQDKINTKGFMNNVVDMFHQATNYFSKGAFVKDDPLKEEKQRAKDYFSDMNMKPSELDINKKAEEIFIDDKNTEKKQQKINQFLGEINDDKIKKYLEVDAEKRFKSIDKDRNSISNRISLNQKYADTLLSDIQSPNISPEQREYKQIEFKKIAGYLKSDVDKYNSFDASKTDSTAEDEFNSFKRNYNTIDNITGRFKASLVDIGSELVAAYGYGSQYTDSGPLGTIQNMKSQEAALEMKKSSDLIRDELRPENKEITLGNFIQSSTDILAGAAPSLIVAGSTGGAGAAILGIGKAGSTYNEMWKKQMSGKENYSPAQMAFAPLVSGVSNALLYEIPTFYSLRNAKNVFKAAMREEASSLMMSESIKKSSIELGKTLFKNVGVQVPTAVTDNIVQNAIKRDILGDNSVHYMDGNWGVIKNTGIIAGLISATPHIGVGIVKMFSKTSDAQILERNGIKIKEYLTQLNDVNLDEKTKGILEKSIDKMTKESSEITNKTINNIAKIDESKIETVAKNNKRIDEVKTEVKVIKDNDNLNIEQKQFELDGLKKETIQIVKENKDIIEEADKTPTRKGRGNKATEENKNVFYYKNEAPSEVPEGYTTMKKVENSAEIKLFEEQEAKPKGIEDVISKPIELDINTNKSEENKPNTTIEEKNAEVEKLREEEQNEYKDVSPDDKVKLGEIYNKYDKLISPLLREIKAEGKPTEEAKSTEVKTKAPEVDNAKPLEVKVKPVKEKWQIDYERRVEKVNEFNSKNRPLALEKDKVDLYDRKNSEKRRDLEDEIYEAKQRISRSDDADLAIEKYNETKKKLEDYDNETQDLQDSRDIDSLIHDEIEHKEKDGDRYEFPKELNKDPREAALKRSNEMIDFLKERGEKNESILKYENDVKILEKDIKENPLKENTISKTEEPTPTKSRKKPKTKLEEETTPKVETEKEIVSLPEVIDDKNFDDIVNKLIESDKVTRPCE